jgi:hypothetical protein
MRKLIFAAFAVAFTFAFASIVFTAVSGYSGTPAHQLCTVGTSLCSRPSVLLLPSALSLAWGWMLQLIDER